MRSLLGIFFVVVATVLGSHGLFTDAESRDALGEARSQTGPLEAAALRRVTRTFPYGRAAVEAERLLVEQSREARDLPSNGDFFGIAWAKVESGVRERAPWVLPPTAAVAGIAGLLLAVLLPRTRFRGMTLLIALAGSAAAMPSLMAGERQGELVQSFPPVGHVLAHFPWIALALLASAGITLTMRRDSGQT